MLLVAHLFAFIVIVCDDDFVSVTFLPIFEVQYVVNMPHQVRFSLLL